MKRNLRAGIVGFGVMGKNHSRVLNSLPGVDLMGVCDPAINLNSSHLNHSIYDEIEKLIAVGINYAVVAVPTQLHLEVVEKLATSNIHVLIEKPISFDSSSARKIEEILSSSGTKGAIGHIERFNPAVKEAKRRLESLGDLYQISTRRQGPFPGRVTDVGVIKDLATHDIDIASWITGRDYVSVTGQATRRTGRDNEDLFVGIAQMKDGIITSHVVNWLSPQKERVVVLTGEKGAFAIDTLTADLTHYANGVSETEWNELARFRGVSEGDVTRFSFPKREPLLIEHEEFRNYILDEESEVVTVKEGIKVVEVAEAFLKSADLGQTVHLG